MSYLDDLIQESNDSYNKKVTEKSEKKARDDKDTSDMMAFNENYNNFSSNYRKWADANHTEKDYSPLSDKELNDRIARYVKNIGINEGELTADSSDADVARYGNTIIDNVNADYITYEDYIKDQGSDEERASYNFLRNYENYSRQRDKMTVDQQRKLDGVRDKALETIKEGKKKFDEWRNENYSDANERFRAFDYYFDKYGNEDSSSNPTTSDTESNTESNTDSSSDDGTTGEEIVLNVKPGDTFGQMLLDNGLVTDKGLWGPDGDVEFYTKQLNDANHMNLIYPGQAIRLKRRK